MSDRDPVTSHGPDGLWRWLLGGLAGGAAVLGLLIAAYAIGYHRGQDAGTSSKGASASTSAPTTTTSASKPGAFGPVRVTAALVARGRSLYAKDGCSACHSLSGAPGAGPTFKGLAGGTSALTTGETVSVDDAYLERSIADPDTQIVKGYRQGIMAPAVESFDLGAKRGDIRAVVAFIKAQK